MIQPYRIAVFASGSGSNFQAIVDAIREGQLDVSLDLIVCDNSSALVVERAEKAGIPAYVFRAKDYASRDAYEQTIVQQLQARNIDLIVLAGYMRIVGETLLGQYEGRMINIHPSLLPSFPGLNAIGQALAHGVKQTGVTVHLVDGGMDTGPIIAQRAVEVRDHDTEETLAARIHPVEHDLYPQVIQWFRQKRIQLNGKKVTLRG